MTTILDQISRGTYVYLRDDKTFFGYATGQSTPDGDYFWVDQNMRTHFNFKGQVHKPLPQDVCVPVSAVTHLNPSTIFTPARIRLSLTQEQVDRLPTRDAIESGAVNGAVRQTSRTMPMFAQQFDTRDLNEIGERALRQMQEAKQHREKMRMEYGISSPEQEALLDRQLAVTLEAIKNAYEREVAPFMGGK